MCPFGAGLIFFHHTVLLSLVQGFLTVSYPLAACLLIFQHGSGVSKNFLEIRDQKETLQFGA